MTALGLALLAAGPAHASRARSNGQLASKRAIAGALELRISDLENQLAELHSASATPELEFQGGPEVVEGARRELEQRRSQLREIRNQIRKLQRTFRNSATRRDS